MTRGCCFASATWLRRLTRCRNGSREPSSRRNAIRQCARPPNRMRRSIDRRMIYVVVLAALGACTASDAASRQPLPEKKPAPPSGELVVRVLDVGQGDATLIENGGSRVLIDGGPEQS